MADVNLPTLYEYYCEGGVQSGLRDTQPQFTLNNKNIVLYSGALHYFRVPQIYWRDRLRKYRAAGLNSVETYVPWNLHEPLDGVFDFGSGGSDHEEFLDIVKFMKVAREEDLFVILRPGPYICAEWEYGGLPSWLLRYEGIKVRTSDDKYISFVKRYFQRLLELLEPLQFTKGGPIIAVQIENEYGNVKDSENAIDTAYLQTLKNILQNNGIVELLFTSDTPSEGFSGTLSGVLATANFQEKPSYELGLLKSHQPDKPMMVMEYWTGWFDHWSEKHHTRTAEEFGQVLEEILAAGASVNMYMFHGGTNWGFLNGANIKGPFRDNQVQRFVGSGCVGMAEANLPTLYEYYCKGGVQTGLSDKEPQFTLNNRNIVLYGGSLHYFRVPQTYWRDRLRKYRAAGLNSVETYVPWNLHEPLDGVFDFGTGGTDYEEFLDIVKFLKLAKDEDLFVILRPGPYICAEWEYGGLPSWLLRYENIRVRTSDEKYISFVKRYFKKLVELINPLQFTKGGPIIAVQIENEYGTIKDADNPIDTAYLQTLKNILEDNGIVELLFTSDTPSEGFSGTLSGVLATANFQKMPIYELELLKNYQPDKPMMVTEYWTGKYDHWTEKHNTRTVAEFGKVLEEILAFGASVNMYMFHGGTNWGFLNGADIMGLFIDNEGYQPDVTTYDYDAPLNEAGDYTDKYYKAKEIISKYNKIKLKQPALPELTKRISYPPIIITEELSLNDIITQSKVVKSAKLLPMEMLLLNNNSGQSYGYVVYRKTNIDIPKHAVLKIEGRVCDTVLVLVNGVLKSKVLKTVRDLDEFGYWKIKDSTLNLGDVEYKNATLDLVVENWGRVNYGKLYQFKQHKGLWQGNVLINDNVLNSWEIIPLEFQKSWLKKLTNWKKPTSTSGPKLLKAVLNVTKPNDTYIDMREWNKGFIVINNFVLARYTRLGPQQSAYLPATFLREGQNDILIFEHFIPAKKVTFTENLIFEEFVELK